MSNLTATRPPQPWTAPTATDPVAATLRLPGSKSMTARALVLSALAGGPSTLRAPLRARDTELMAAGLRALGAHVSICRRRALGGPAAPAGRPGPRRRRPGRHGDALPAAGGRRWPTGTVTFDGDPHARSRPLGPLLEALRALGVRIDARRHRRPAADRARHRPGRAAARSSSTPPPPASSSPGCCSPRPRFDRGVVVRHVGPPVPVRAAPADDRADAARRRRRRRRQRPRRLGGRAGPAAPAAAWEIEPDLSGAAPFLAAALVTGGEVTLPGWPRSSAQPVDQLRELLHRDGRRRSPSPTHGLTVRGTGAVHGIDADLSDVSELTPVLAALAALADSPSRLRGVGHIRGHETDRLAALARELTALGARRRRDARTGWRSGPGRCAARVFETYADHRMAHAAAVIGLRRAGHRARRRGVYLQDACPSSRHYGQRW